MEKLTLNNIKYRLEITKRICIIEDLIVWANNFFDDDIEVQSRLDDIECFKSFLEQKLEKIID